MTRTLPRLHLITDDAVLARPDFAETAARLLERCGQDVALHVRGHHTTGAKLYAITEALSEPARNSRASLFVNDRVDIALALHADGVQLGARSMTIEDARRLLPPDTWIGFSAHSAESAEFAVSERAAKSSAAAPGADLVILGTIYDSGSHPGRTPAGPALVKETAARVSVPVIAIGGITTARVREVVDAGAHGVAVLGGVWREADAVAAAIAYVDAVKDAWRSREVSQ